MNGNPVVASLFSGCGGSTLGYKRAGFDVVFANEFIEAARHCYLANFPDTHIDQRDVRDLKGEDIIAKELSLAGVQRPTPRDIIGGSAVQWFQYGDFAGWLIE